MNLELILTYFDFEEIEELRIPIYEKYEKGSFELHHACRNPEIDIQSDLFILTKDGISASSMFKNITDFYTNLIAYIFSKREDSLFLYGRYYDCTKNNFIEIPEIEVSSIIGGVILRT